MCLCTILRNVFVRIVVWVWRLPVASLVSFGGLAIFLGLWALRCLRGKVGARCGGRRARIWVCKLCNIACDGNTFSHSFTLLLLYAIHTSIVTQHKDITNVCAKQNFYEYSFIRLCLSWGILCWLGYAMLLNISHIYPCSICFGAFLPFYA